LSEIILKIAGVELVDLYGEKNSKLNILQEAYPDVKITSRGSSLKLSGDKKQTQTVKSKVELMVRVLKQEKELKKITVEDIVHGKNPFQSNGYNNMSATTIVHGRDGKPIKARTRNQKLLVDLSEKNDVVFAIGPAGTGKTYVAVALAVKALKNRLVKKIILTRPAVEAGENLGFLPGDLKDKVDPYLRPLYDALDDLLEGDKINKFMTDRVIEVAPLAFMRGRTLDNAFIILDEAQNTTSMQIKMFLTRLGPNAKCIITGDLTQIDLPRRQRSGLHKALDILGDVQGIGRVFLKAEDVVRHRLVKEIILAYEQDAESDFRNNENEFKKEKSEEE